MFLGSCSRSSAPAVERVALLPFDNQSGDASLDWMSQAIPKVAAEQLTGVTKAMPILAPALRDAELAGATRYIHGYFDRRRGTRHFEVWTEDASSHKMVSTRALQGAPLQIADNIAKTIDPAAHPFSTKSPAALAAWAMGDYKTAVAEDPDFSNAYLSWANSLAARRDTAQALEVAQRGLSRAPLRSAIDQAQLEFAAATLKQDEPARAKAIEALSKLVTNDVSVLKSLAEAQMRGRRYSEAAALYEKALAIEPADAGLMNMLGYAYALAGDLNKSQAAFTQYGKQPGQEPNSLDSLGEAYFLNGRFADAEKQFLAAHTKNPNMLAGGDLAKAAYAHWLGGDLGGADAMFEKYLDFRVKSGDALVGWRKAVWQYATGHADQAMATLRDTPAQAADVAGKQLAVWKNPDAVPHDLALLKQAYERTSPSTDGLARVLYAEALFKEGRKDEAKKMLQHWPLPENPEDPLLESLVYPKYLALRDQVR